MDILDLLRSDGSIVVNKKLAHKIGLDQAVVYAELVSLYKYWADRGKLKDEKWFFCTIDNLQENTTLKKDKQNRAINSLEKNHKLIKTKRMGLPAKRYFTITDEILNIVANKISQNAKTDSDGGSELENEDEARPDQISQKPQTRGSDLRKPDFAKTATNNTIFNNTEFNNLEEEEEQQPLIDSKIKTLFLNQGFDDQEICKIFNHVEKKSYDLSKITEATLIESIKQTNKDLRTGVANDFYTWLAGKIDRLIKADKHKQKGEPEKKKQTKGKPSVRKDKVPSYIQDGHQEKEMDLQEQIEKKEQMAEMLKKHKGQEWYDDQLLMIEEMKQQQQENYITRAAW